MDTPDSNTPLKADVQAKLTEAQQHLGDDEAFNILVRAAQAGYDSQTWINCIIELGKLDNPQLLEPILSFLELKNGFGDWAAIALYWLSDKETALLALLNRVQDPSPIVREHVVQALCNLVRPQLPKVWNKLEVRMPTFIHEPIDDRILNALLEKLKDESPAVKTSSVAALCNLGDQRATEEVINALQDPDKAVRLAAAAWLGSLGDKQAIDPLVQAMHSGDKGLERAATHSLVMLGQLEAVEALTTEAFKGFGHNVQASAQNLMQGFSKTAAAPIPQTFDPGKQVQINAMLQNFADLNKLNDEGGIEQLMQGFVNQPLTTEPAEVVPLIANLKNPDSSVRANAAIRLGIIGDITAVEPLIAALGDQELAVRSNVITALGALKDVRAIEPLLNLLMTSKELSTNTDVGDTLSRMNDRRAIETILNLLEGNTISDELIQKVIYTLGLVSARQAYPLALKTVKESHNKNLRLTGLVALGQLGNEWNTLEETLQILLETFKTGDSEERSAASQGLDYLSNSLKG